MIPDNILHDRERGEESQQHLNENYDKFQSDAIFLLGLMIKGERLSAKTVVQKYGKESRRLRDLHIAGKCEKAWVTNEKGKRLYVEYFVTPPQQMTKGKLINIFTKELVQQNLFD